MKKHCILISGPTIAGDRKLIDKLQKSKMVLKNRDNTQIESIIGDGKVALILLEITKDSPSELEVIKNVKSIYPGMEIIMINGGDREVIATAFEYGAKDAFKIPYKSSLIVERVNAILDTNCRLSRIGG